MHELEKGEKMVTITDRAAAEIKNILKKENKPGYGIRIFIAGASCSGPQYGMMLEEKPGEGDKIIESNGVKIIIDKKLELYLDGSEIDYVETPYGSGFSITNSNVGASCGSGCSSCH
jgi:iron-sulfur cluster assembly accessory protein